MPKIKKFFQKSLDFLTNRDYNRMRQAKQWLKEPEHQTNWPVIEKQYTVFARKEHQLMASVLEMAKSHLLNVEREINVLHERKAQIDQEIEKLSSYLNEGNQVISASEQTLKPAQEGSHATIFNPSNP